MTDMATNGTCKRNCWIAAAVIGALVALFALGADRGIVAAILLGVLSAALLGSLFVWLTCAPVPTLGVRKASAPTPSPAAAPKPAAASKAEAPAPAPTGSAAQPSAAAPVSDKAAAEPENDEPVIKPSKPLAGQAELASRKGDWTYQGGSETKPEAAPASDEGERQPEALSAPRGSGADDLKEIKGVGPKLETLLHDLGIYHFDQIAGWSAAEVAWMDDNLKGFRGRVSRDDWIGQAKILAAGGETDFSTRVDNGEVY